MKNQSKKIISIMLMASLILAAVALALPNSTSSAASSITATTTTIEQSGLPGSTLYYPITINNGDTNPAALTIDYDSELGKPNSTTSTQILPNSITIAASSSSTIMVNVSISSTATTGTSDVISVRIMSGSDQVAVVSLIVHVANPTAGASDRPQLNITSYSINAKYAKVGSIITLTGVLENRGTTMAYNNNISFEGDGFFPMGNGGVQYIQNISPSGGKWTFTENFTVGDALDYVETGVIKATVAYLDSAGKAYTDTFSLSIPVTSGVNSGATATPKTTLRPQLVVTKNSTDVDPLQPGSLFELNLTVKNFGTTDAKSVIMVLGGGASSVNDLGTPQPGTGADLTNFAQIGSSNVVVIGDVAQGAEVNIKVKLVVNVTTVPGAYTLKTSFVYTDASTKQFVDDQVITLLVYSLPQVEVNFYRDPGVISAGMPNTLPLQVTNLGKKSTILGNMTVSVEGLDVTNNTALVGALDPGGYFTLDSEVMPALEGPLEVKVTINYTDDFNQSREIVQTLNLNVMPAQVMTPEPSLGPDGKPIDQQPVVETFWAKVGRFFKGLFGLGSGVKQPDTSGVSTDVPSGGGGGSGPIIVGPKG